MKTFTLLFVLLFAAAAGFAALNWGALSAPTTLTLGMASFVAPLGEVMLGLLAGVSVFFLLWIVAAQVSASREERRLSRILEVAHDLARKVEADRFDELRQFVVNELKAQSVRVEASREELLSKLTGLQTALRASIEESGNALAAYFGQLEDEIERDHVRAARRL